MSEHATRDDLRGLAALAEDIGQRLRRFPDRSSAAAALTTVARELVPGAEDAGMTLLRRSGTFVTMGATSPLVTEVDRLQYELGTGPCVDTVATEELVVVGDLATDPRWPVFGPAAAERGVLSMASYRLALFDSSADVADSRDAIGGLNLYSSRLDAFAPDVVGPALAALSTHAALAVWGGALAEEVAQLGQALSTSRWIGMAQGILVERLKITPEEAFRLLTTVSQNSNRKLHDVAVRLVETGEVPLPRRGSPVGGRPPG